MNENSSVKNPYTDSRYSAFVAPSKERISFYKDEKRKIQGEYNSAKEKYQEENKKISELEEKLIREDSYSKREARAYAKPSKLRNRDHLHNARQLERLAFKKNRVLIYPFKLFYKPVEVDGNGLLKPRFHTLLAFTVILVLALLSRIFIVFDQADWVTQYFSESWNFIWEWNWNNFGMILSQLFGPQNTGLTKLTTWDQWFGYMWNTAVPLLWETFMMMFLATVMGSILAIPFMILCSKNIVKSRTVTGIFRVLLNILRTFPTVILAIMGTAFFGIGAKAGIFAMTLFTMGIMIKIMYERIETVDMHPYEASVSTGGSKPKAFVTSIAPQIIPDYLSNFLYTFEINIRASVILGFVGAGGIGQEISNCMDSYRYNNIGAIIIPLFILALFLQWLSAFAKRKTQ